MLNIQTLNSIARAMKYVQGTVFNDSVSNGQLYIILQGEAGAVVSREGSAHIQSRLSAGHFFGEQWLFDAADAPDPVVALTDVIALPVSRSTAESFFRDEPALAFDLCRAIWENGRRGGAFRADDADEQPTQSSEAERTGHFPLFPEGHGHYALTLNNADREHLLQRSVSCPLCKQSFRFLSVRPSRLVVESTDSDMRPRYKDVEPLYYDVITCPHCLYSALTDMFDAPRKPSPAFLDELAAYKESSGIDFSAETAADSVFAGYYLALLCAPQCFSRHQLTTAKLLLKLSRVYQDCGDENMEIKTARRALDTYMYIYQNIQLPPEQDQQLCMIVAELSLKLGEPKQAKDFFFKVKINRGAAPLLRRQAENRLFDIRENEK